MDNRSEIKDFLTTRRARLTPAMVGLPTSERRRVPGLRREEVAVLAGVSTEWYTRLEKGHIAGVSEEVLDAVADALNLEEDERAYLMDLARSARHTKRPVTRRREVPIPVELQWMLDSVTGSGAIVRNGRLDITAANALGRALLAPMYESPTAQRRGRDGMEIVPNFGRYFFLDESSRDFFIEWESGASATLALLRAELGREPNDPALRELIEELSEASADFRTFWRSHDIRSRHDGSKRIEHPQVGEIAISYFSVDVPLGSRAWHDLAFWTAKPGSASAEKLRMLASLESTRTAAPSESGAVRGVPAEG